MKRVNIFVHIALNILFFSFFFEGGGEGHEKNKERKTLVLRTGGDTLLYIARDVRG